MLVKLDGGRILMTEHFEGHSSTRLPYIGGDLATCNNNIAQKKRQKDKEN